jgi:hypothetical protein
MKIILKIVTVQDNLHKKDDNFLFIMISNNNVIVFHV